MRIDGRIIPYKPTLKQENPARILPREHVQDHFRAIRQEIVQAVQAREASRPVLSLDDQSKFGAFVSDLKQRSIPEQLKYFAHQIDASSSLIDYYAKKKPPIKLEGFYRKNRAELDLKFLNGVANSPEVVRQGDMASREPVLHKIERMQQCYSDDKKRAEVFESYYSTQVSGIKIIKNIHAEAQKKEEKPSFWQRIFRWIERLMPSSSAAIQQNIREQAVFTQRRIQNLARGEFYSFDAGWSSFSTGHANRIMLEKKDDHYLMTIVDLGRGASRAISDPQNPDYIRCRQFRVESNIIEGEKGIEGFMSLFCLNIAPVKDEEALEVIFQEIPGLWEVREIHNTSLPLLEVQRHGYCTVDSTRGVQDLVLGEEDSRELEMIKLQVLIKNYDGNSTFQPLVDEAKDKLKGMETYAVCQRSLSQV